jgi:hypothetical protein
MKIDAAGRQLTPAQLLIADAIERLLANSENGNATPVSLGLES